MVEGVHFDRRWCPADAVGWKLVTCNVSDIAAMGGLPEWALLTCGFPGDLPLAWAEDLLDGVARACAAFDLAVVGGDITGSPGPIVLSLSAFGIPGERVLTRSAASLDQGLYVTGPLGASALGLRALRSGAADPPPVAVKAHLYPAPRVVEGRRLAACHAVGACMDLSDGLGVDAARMAAASGVGLEVDAALLPLGEELSGLPREEALELALFGGEDYELLFTCSGTPPVPAVRVGRVVARPGLHVLLDGAPWSRGRPFDHFAPQPEGQ